MTLNPILEEEPTEKEIPLWERFHDAILDNKNSITIFSVGCGILFGIYTLNKNKDKIEKKIIELSEQVKEMSLELCKIDDFIKNRHMIKKYQN